MASSMASSTESRLDTGHTLLVDGTAQEIGAERRDMRVTFVADHRQHDLSAMKNHEILWKVIFQDPKVRTFVFACILS